jgi:hypothetical protein
VDLYDKKAEKIKERIYMRRDSLRKNRDDGDKMC